MWIPGVPQTMFREREKCTRLQYPEGFAEKPGAVGDVHGHVLRVGTVEGTGRIRQPLTVSLLKGDLAYHVNQRGEL